MESECFFQATEAISVNMKSFLFVIIMKHLIFLVTFFSNINKYNKYSMESNNSNDSVEFDMKVSLLE